MLKKLKQIFVLYLISMQLLAPVKAQLRQDLHDFFNLVPKTRIGYLAARHYIFDDQFRDSVQFLRSPQFKQEWNKIRHSPEFVALIDFVRNQQEPAVSLTALQDINGAIDKLPNQLRTFCIPAKVPVTLMMQRNFMSFMREVMQALPRARFSSLMARKVAEGGDFARLYKAVQQKEFKLLVATFKASSNLQTSWSELRKHYIEINDLIEMADEIISWGPLENL